MQGAAIVAGGAVILWTATSPLIPESMITPSSELMLECHGIVFEESVGVPSALISLSMELEEYSGRRVDWTAIGAYAAHTRNGASTPRHVNI